MGAKNYFGIVILILAIAILSAPASAASVIVEKSVEPKTLDAGDKATVSLDIKNPFNQAISIKIADKNIFANNGLDVQCIEYSIPAMSTAHLAYDPIQLFAPGKYALEPAKVTYTNPDTKKEETALSNTIDADVGGNAAGASQQAITTIYRCNGQSMTSTSYSSSGSPQQQQQNSNNNQNQQQQPQTPSAYDKMQNSQMPQDADALKREMQKQAEEEKKMNEEFAKEAAKNPDLQKMQKELAEKGFSPKSQSVSAESNNTGSFELNYTKPNGETAKIAGKMENGEMKDLYSENSEESKSIMDLLRNNSNYQKYEEALKKEGMSEMQPQIQKRNETYTVKVPFNGAANISTNIEARPPNVTVPSANITAIIANNTVQEVNLEKDSSKKQYFWLILAALLIAAAYAAYLKHMKPKPAIPVKVPADAPKIDYLAEAKSMLSRAKELFSEGMEKEAYALVSEAVRYYFSHRLGMKKELTASELVQHLRRAKFKYANVQKCLNLCALVEFAKYVPNKEDFEEIVALAEREIK